MKLHDTVRALRDYPNADPQWEHGIVIGKWREETIHGDPQSGFKIQFADGIIQDVPLNFTKRT